MANSQEKIISMRYFAFFFCALAFFCSCRKAQIVPTQEKIIAAPWTDSSAHHPKNARFLALLEKYRKKGLPGISLLVRDQSGTWFGSAGKSDLSNNVAFHPGTISKAASITKL